MNKSQAKLMTVDGGGLTGMDWACIRGVAGPLMTRGRLRRSSDIYMKATHFILRIELLHLERPVWREVVVRAISRSWVCMKSCRRSCRGTTTTCMSSGCRG